jgi:hypothetical protein
MRNFTHKTAVILIAILLIAVALTGCGQEVFLLSATDYEYVSDMEQTSRGISVGDDADAFLAAYGDYEILTLVDDSYELLAAEEIPFDSDSLTTLLPTFFIDGTATDTSLFCKENDIEKSDLLAFLTSEDYLSSHTVVYRYLVFTWEKGVITDIQSESMDYNADAAYYDAN